MTASDIFTIKNEDEFLEKSLKVFRYQYRYVYVYRKFVDYLKIDPNEVAEIQQIPFLPIEMFKNHSVLDKNRNAAQFFQSSGTTDILKRSKHQIADLKLYEHSIIESFKTFIGNPKDFVFLALLPNYSANPHSSLIYMVDYLMKVSEHRSSGYFLNNFGELHERISKIKDRKILLFGVSFALLDFADYISDNSKEKLPKSVTVIETGGMKGRKEEITKDQLLEQLQFGLGISSIFSEYSMTELLSQGYSLGSNQYFCPNWMRILCRNTEDPFSYVPKGRSGAVNIIDLANLHSCSFIATQDLGKVLTEQRSNHLSPGFEILGRIDHSDIRGCSLLVS